MIWLGVQKKNKRHRNVSRGIVGGFAYDKNTLSLFIEVAMLNPAYRLVILGGIHSVLRFCLRALVSFGLVLYTSLFILKKMCNSMFKSFAVVTSYKLQLLCKKIILLLLNVTGF